MASSLDQQRPNPDYVSTGELLAAVPGLTKRQVDHWCRTRRLAPAIGGPGTRPGSNWWWSPTQIDQLRRIVARLAWGMTVDAAFRTIDPPLPAPSTIDQAAQPCTPGA